jgi:hypothetical protein
MKAKAPGFTIEFARNFLQGVASVFDVFPGPSHVYGRMLRSTPERFAQTNRRIGNSLDRASKAVTHDQHKERPARRLDARTNTLVALGYLSENDLR